MMGFANSVEKRAIGSTHPTILNRRTQHRQDLEQATCKHEGSVMGSFTRIALIGTVVFATSVADAATITGTVKGPDGQAFRGAFVQARNAKTKITVSVLSD